MKKITILNRRNLLLILVLFLFEPYIFNILTLAKGVYKEILTSKTEFVLNKNEVVKDIDFIKKTETRRHKKSFDRYFITGYQAVAKQTDDTPNIAAWNDNIKNAVNVAAVVQDSPFKRGTCLKIKGLNKTYIVLDHFHKRYNGKKKIDLLVKTKKEAKKITGWKKIEILPPGNCGLIRVVNGKEITEKFSKRRRFKI